MRLGGVAFVALAMVSAGCVAGLAAEDPARELEGQTTEERQDPVFSDPIVVDDERDLTEPAVEVDSEGRVYVAGIPGVTGSVSDGQEDTTGASQIFGSLDGGQSFELIDPLPSGLYGASFGGGDVDLALGSADEVYMTDLWAGNAGFVASGDHGETWPTSTPAIFTFPGIDRQWIDTHADTGAIYVSAQSLSTGAVREVANTDSNLVLAKSEDGGETFSVERPIGTEERNLISPSGPLVVNEARDEIAIPYSTSSGGQGVAVSVTPDEGDTWEHTSIPGIDEQTTVFPVIADDNAGNLYLVTTLDDRIVLSTSGDGGRTWTTPEVVDPDPGEEQIIPWVVAGDAGELAVSWREASTEGDPQRWDYELATITNGLSSDPSVTVHQLNDEPIDEGDYSLREVNELAIGPDGAVHAAWPSLPADGEDTVTQYARQIDGAPLAGDGSVEGFAPSP
ncbi:hypothetical protein BRD56_07795 [Thermoplasmatales archaeon SW_10_69_26]|nr:MAG: hypothetical protein BRD56_07795 [Thermoplasmatales archaeon SW_10_69_26]